ncbi:hypothetical protein IE53DRAFT_391258 [Violaceomyces palustris]|uniref:Uncharacterized protein n=1 Tax=Violaceomyces palustris TaxID=1673888 RepID=A0ACD0NL74_9BASI|nr:hypothetical protein IE53DRAFT_391258 [Violaceomyces palustris]
MPNLTNYQQDEENERVRSAEQGASPEICTDSGAPSTPGHTTPERLEVDTTYQRFRKELRRRILHTTPSWFAVTMGTGITSILLHQLPYQFHGLDVISNIIFALNVCLYLLFLGLSIARYTIWPQMFKIMLFHPTQSLFLGTFPMGLATIINMIVFSLVPAWGPAWSTFAWVLWWIDVLLALVIAIGIPFVQFTRHSQSFDNITGVWLLPVVAPVVVASTGGVVASVLPPDHARLTITVSYILWGTGVPISVMLMTLYYARLAIYKIPPATMIVSAFLPLGPCGQGAFGLLQLSRDLVSIVTEEAGRSGIAPLGGQVGTERALIMAYAVQAVTIPIALVLWGLGLVWLCLAVATITDMAFASVVPLNLGWWGFTFPLGVFATATTALASELGSEAFKVLGTVLSITEVLLWLFLICVTGFRAITGEMFFSPCLAELGGEPPKYMAPARKYAYQPRANPPTLFPTPSFGFGASWTGDGCTNSQESSDLGGGGLVGKIWKSLSRSRSRGRALPSSHDRSERDKSLEAPGRGGGGGGTEAERGRRPNPKPFGSLGGDGRAVTALGPDDPPPKPHPDPTSTTGRVVFGSKE